MEPERPIDGYAKLTLASGTRYHVMHYSADPEKDAAWAEEALRGVPPRIRRREYELDENVSDGTPYWENYLDFLHCVKKEASRQISYIEGAHLVGGWDCGMARMPAFALAQITPKARQVQWLFEVVPSSPMAMETFAPIVRQRLQALLPGAWNRIVHVGDATVTTRGGNVERSAGDVARRFGFHIRPMTNSIDAREEAVIWLLTNYCSQEGDSSTWLPRVVYAERGCPVLVDGMRGSYCLAPAPGGDLSGPGASYHLPKKNFFSHVNDAHQYASMWIHQQLTGSRAVRRARIR